MQPKDLTVDEAIKLVRELEDGEKLMGITMDQLIDLTNEMSEESLRNLFEPADGN